MKDNIIIFGASTRGIYAYNKLKIKYNIVAFADNDNNKWGSNIQEINVISPEKLMDLNVKIVIASQYDREIKNQLINLGINNFEVYPSSIEIVLDKLSEKGVEVNKSHALQTFGGNGDGMERFYKDKVKDLDVWEIEKSHEEKLRKNLPNANIKITDSFKEIRKTDKKYNLILMDNPMGEFAGHCEHFDMYMELFGVMEEECTVIMDIIPNIIDIDEKYNYLCSSNHLLARKLFYRTNNPKNITIEKMVKVYKEIAVEKGYKLNWYFCEERSGEFIQYLIINLKKKLGRNI